MGIKSQIILTLLLVIAITSALNDGLEYKNAGKSGVQGTRIKRQEETSTTTRAPPKRRPQGIFSLFSTLLRETRDDARRAFQEIGTMFNSQFTTPKPRPTSSTTATSEDGEDPTTTTEAYRISRNEFNGIIRSNLVGIGRLFRKEFSNAISDSGKNLQQFGRELRSQVRPYVEIRTGSRNITMGG